MPGHYPSSLSPKTPAVTDTLPERSVIRIVALCSGALLEARLGRARAL